MSADAASIRRALDEAAASASTMAAARSVCAIIEDLRRHVGAPGDWGYGTPLGDALAALVNGSAGLAARAIHCLDGAPSHGTVAHALVGEEIAP